MTTHTPEELHEIGQRAITRLDAWLKDISKQEDPIETALDDLHGFLEELEQVRDEQCWLHSEKMCVPCLSLHITEANTAMGRLRELWEARA
jgi:hypothetical protein